LNKPLVFAGLSLVCALAACGDEIVPAAELGERLFSETRVSTSRRNRYSCATCHTVQAGAPIVMPGRYDSGYNLADVFSRSGWWGGYAGRVLDAINVCVTEFMGGRRLLPEDAESRQLGAYLSAASEPGPQPLAPFTIVRAVTPLDGMAGDPARGAAIYTTGCYRCHGAVRSGAGRLDETFSIIPDDTIKGFGDRARHAVVEKIRHGRFFNIGGVMPLYTLEAMTDGEVADLLAYLGL
jgi:thiosulfate dehydrogenase